MTHFIRILTAATIIVHATLGCCAHEGLHLDDGVCEHHVQATCEHDDAEHEHAHSTEDHVIEANVENHREACDRHCTAYLAEDCPAEHSGSHECDHAKCSWSITSLRDCEQIEYQQFALIAENCLVCNFAAQQQTSPETSVLDVLSMGSVRAHLVICVLLI